MRDITDGFVDNTITKARNSRSLPANTVHLLATIFQERNSSETGPNLSRPKSPRECCCWPPCSPTVLRLAPPVPFAFCPPAWGAPTPALVEEQPDTPCVPPFFWDLRTLWSWHHIAHLSVKQKRGVVLYRIGRFLSYPGPLGAPNSSSPPPSGLVRWYSRGLRMDPGCIHSKLSMASLGNEWGAPDIFGLIFIGGI